MDEIKRQTILDNLRERIRTRIADRAHPALERIAERYYAGAALEDLESVAAEDLYGALLSHWHTAERRMPGTPVLRVYNPVFEQDGWRSPHTVVEVITDDMPFLVDSLSMALSQRRLTLHALVHPTFAVLRDGDGAMRGLAEEIADDAATREAWMRFEIDPLASAAEREALRVELLAILADIRAVVDDWPRLRTRMQAAITELESLATELPGPRTELDETLAFLRWLDDHHFTYIGFREFDLRRDQDGEYLEQTKASALGIFRLRTVKSVLRIPPHLRALALRPNPLVLTKSAVLSTVHRPVQLDYVGVKRFDAHGAVRGEWRFQGLYTSAAYDARPSQIPLLRHKLAGIIARAAFDPAGHASKALEHILHTLPRDELIQSDIATLHDTAIGILSHQGRQKLKVYVRPDAYGRFVSVLVFAPRDRYDTQLRKRMQGILIRQFDGTGSEFNIQFTEGVTAQVHFIVWTEPGPPRAFDTRALEAILVEATLAWADVLRQELREVFGESAGLVLFERYGEAFPLGYRDECTPRTAVLDIQRIESITADRPLAMHLYRPPEASADLRFKLYGRARALPLSDVLPMLERMGLKVLGATPYEIRSATTGDCWILNFDLAPVVKVDIDIPEVKERFQEAFARICAGQMESDGFNALILLAGLDWREVVLLRAYCKYLLQTRVPFSQTYMEDVLLRNPGIARQLTELFHSLLSPRESASTSQQQERIARCEQAIDGVASLDEDRILRLFLNTLRATLRTNYFQLDTNGEPKPQLALKFDSAQVPELPQPRPKYEIFVYAPHVEGVHLRGGVVARGGLRWSDRREDFRTEVLGLMKAQMIKNALIVPVGAKGGFVAKKLSPTAGRDEVQQEVIRCYRSFIHGLLDLTDNRVGTTVVPPPEVVRRDGDDPYLVVAADKGTASFSDLANEIAAEYGFWLGDAFASGGSRGYDHKKMGITARGAWISVRRHFAEMGKDVQTAPFNVIAIGDMSGDVFGNGMLQSRQIRLLAAFNHQHIFIDPDPDPEATFRERERLFALPRSSWQDYDASVISAGGGVYARSAKSIHLSEAARAALAIESARLSPHDLIRALLRAPVDLLWNGGIGTYVKAGAESHADVGDRTNDPLRINADELRCAVIGEGGNLGLTQRARIEYALNGGRINTDAIDNSGGVACSDHEVNIKIVLDQTVADGDLTLKQRNQCLQDMTEAVAQLVLRGNERQTQAISLAERYAGYFLYDHLRMIERMEQEGRIDRQLEALPTNAALIQRESDKRGLSRPEIAVLLAYSKIRTYQALVESDLQGDDFLRRELYDYFPAGLQPAFQPAMEQHSLRQEITATHLTNQVIDRMGGTFIQRMEDETDAAIPAIVRAYLIAREVFRTDALWAAIDTLDAVRFADVQLDMQFEIRRLLDRATRWLLRQHPGALPVCATATQFQPVTDEVLGLLPYALCGEGRQQLERAAQALIDRGAPPELAWQIANLDPAIVALDIAAVARQDGHAVEQVALIHYALGDFLDLAWLGERLRELPRDNRWKRGVRTSLREDANRSRRRITEQVLHRGDDADPLDVPTQLANWRDAHAVPFTRYHAIITELRASTNGKPDLAMLTVATEALRALAIGG
ncbi:MAG: NAD-glutamate dehydrogenase [Thiotrichales bacterium]